MVRANLLSAFDNGLWGLPLLPLVLHLRHLLGVDARYENVKNVAMRIPSYRKHDVRLTCMGSCCSDPPAATGTSQR